MAAINITVNGLDFENPFVIGSGPPSTNANTIIKAFDEGWGGVVAKTCSLPSTEVINVVPRYGKLRNSKGDIIGFENIELISDRTLDQWLDDFKRVKDKHPKKILIASIMERNNKDAWQELTGLICETGVDMFELNFSCPHGHPETGMGAAMGQNPPLVKQVTSWVVDVAKRPVWAKMTPDIANIVTPAIAAVEGGANGISAINTIPSIIGVDLEKLRPMPTVDGYTTPGGYSYIAVKPIALRMVSQLAKGLPGVEISAIGGVVNSSDAIEFLLLGGSTVQVCTGVMLHGYEMIHELKEGLSRFMFKHGFKSVREFVGYCLPYITSHHALVEKRLQKQSNALQSNRDNSWSGNIASETEAFVSN